MKIHIMQAVPLSTSKREYCDVTVAFTFCLFKYSQRCSAGADVWWLWRERPARQHSLLFLGLQTDLAQRRRGFRGPLSRWKMNPFPHDFQSEGAWPLKNGTVLLFGRRVVHPLRGTGFWEGKTSPTSEYFYWIWLEALYLVVAASRVVLASLLENLPSVGLATTE